MADRQVELIFDNSEGKIGGETGKWYAGTYGWGFSVVVPQTGRIDHLSGELCRSTDLEAVRARLYAWCAAGLR